MSATRLRRARARRGEGERLRDEILDATLALIGAEGSADKVSVRAVAEAVGVTPPSIYLHFTHKDQLINAVCERLFRELERVSARAMRGIDDPVRAVKAMGRAYVRFGLEHPEGYRILFMTRTLDDSPEAYLERLMGLSGFNLVVEAVRRCMDAGVFRTDDPFTVACGLWAAVHGVTSLMISKPNFPWPKEFLDRSLDMFCRAQEVCP